MQLCPGSLLLSFGQLSLYYFQYTLMNVLSNGFENIQIPSVIMTDGVVKGGRVRVGC